MENKNFVKPKVYLVGYTNVDFDALKEYLKDTDQTEFLQEIYEASAEGLYRRNSL